MNGRAALLGSICAIAVIADAAWAEDSTIDFARDVQPILSDRCYTCHGPDAGQRASDLRLDEQASAWNLAIVPGDADSSELMRRITSDDADERMPPPDSNLRLVDSEREVLRRWIDQGARYAAHWSFAPVTRPPTPTVRDASWPRSPLDLFVLRRLEQEGLAPSPTADPATLVRRVSLDLTGLPPTPSESAAFVAESGRDADGAYRRLVDRLLASERFGERMAVDWLDVASYADTYGYQADRYRAMWPWRDWVIGAFNDNLPFDQFVTWQLAGDLIDDATRDQLLATAFWRNHRQTNEGGSVEEEFRAEYVADRVNTFGAAFLGLTLECCRCHDHKYDPLTQREYYQLSSFFNNIDESGLYSHFTDATPTPTLRLSSPSQQEQWDGLRGLVAAKERELERWRVDAQAFHRWRTSLTDARAASHLEWPPSPGAALRSIDESEPSDTAAPAAVAPPTTLRDQLHRALSASLIGDYPLDDLHDANVPNRAAVAVPGVLVDAPEPIAGAVGRGLLLSGENLIRLESGGDFTRDQPFTIALWIRAPRHFDRAVLLHRSRAWTDSGSRGYELLIERGKLSAALVHFWPGNALRIMTREPLPLDRWVHVAMRYDGSSHAAGLQIVVDGQVVAAEIVRDCLTKHIHGSDGIAGGDATELAIGQRFRDVGFKDGGVDEIKIFDRDLSDLELRMVYLQDAQPDAIDAMLAQASDGELLDFYRRDSTSWRELAAELRSLRDRRSAAGDPIPEIMVMREQPARRPTFVLARGAYDAPTEQVERGVPASILPTPMDPDASRLDLAGWLLDPRHPLTARVAVNRYWQSLFGMGLSRTSEDMGLQGEPPTHPELLDWLSAEFMQSGWDVKRLIRSIVMSATYRQASDPTAELLQRDPENRLLARGPSERLSAEMLRDAALYAGGLLSEKVGGPPVKPYQPDGLWEEKSNASYARDVGEGSHRRGIYTYWKRTSPPPSMMTFDASAREMCVVRRQSTMTPLQTLVLLNDPQFVDAAQALAERAMRVAPDAAKRREFVFQSLTGRTPSAAETKILDQMVRAQRELFAADPEAVESWLAIGDHRAGDDVDRVELAALSVLASGLMSYDDAVMKR